MEDLLFENTIEEGDSLAVDEESIINEVIEELLTVSENEVLLNDGEVGDQSNLSIYGGDDIVNYYNTYISLSGNETISDNTLSESIISKPLNDYSIQEQLTAYGLLIGIGVGFYLIIRRAVFKWQ